MEGAESGALLLPCVCSLVAMFVFGGIGYAMGSSKSVGPFLGALIGVFGGILGLIILAVLPDKAYRRPRRRKRPIGPPRGGRRNRGGRRDCPS